MFAPPEFGTPSGMFRDDLDEGKRASARRISGIVHTAETRTNTVSGCPFYHCTIESYGGTWAAVIPPELCLSRRGRAAFSPASSGGLASPNNPCRRTQQAA